MASTYSSRLRIELIGTGEQSGIWGDTTNTNLGTLIDEAVAGIASITMTDANYTLTVANGATDQSRKAVLVMSGTLTATRNVICPSTQKVYIIKNGTTGGQSIVLKTSAGTGVTVPNGSTMLAYCDGTNVVTGVDAFTAVSTTGNAVVGGTLNVTGATSLSSLATTGNVGIKQASPGSELDVKGTLRLSGSTSGYVGLAPAATAGSTTYTLPSADGTSGQFLSTNGTGTLSWASGLSAGSSNTFTAAQTFRAANAVRSEAASTQDAIVLAGRAGGTSSYAVTLTPATLASNTTLTLPNVTDTLAVLGAAQTFTARQTFQGSSSVLAMAVDNTAELATVSATAATGTINYDITTQSVLYYTSNASGNFTINFRASSGTSLNTAMATGDSVTVAFLCTNGGTAYYNSAVQVDGSSVTPKWQGGTAPSSGNASSIDVYVYTIVKTGSATFTVAASQTKFA